MNIYHRILALLGLVIFTSCEPTEIPIAPVGPSDVETVEIALGSDYGNQLYYSLESNAVIKVNEKTEWDLGFESAETGWRIILNSALFNAVAYVDDSDFSASVNLDSLEWRYDHPSGNEDSTAFGDYRTQSGFFIYDMGNDVDGNARGMRRIKIESQSASEYTIRLADMDMSDETTHSILKDNTTNYTAFHVPSKQVVDIEPSKDSWDILFTQYTYIFHNPPTAYSVTGALINPNQVQVFETFEPWNNIDRDFASGLTYSTERDVIGYDWKEFDFDSGLYNIHTNQIFVIQSVEGKYYKLRFIDFYDDLGERGQPTFEVVQL